MTNRDNQNRKPFSGVYLAIINKEATPFEDILPPELVVRAKHIASDPRHKGLVLLDDEWSIRNYPAGRILFAFTPKGGMTEYEAAIAGASLESISGGEYCIRPWRGDGVLNAASDWAISVIMQNVTISALVATLSAKPDARSDNAVDG